MEKNKGTSKLAFSEEQELIKRAKSGDVSARNDLIIRSQTMLEILASKYIKYTRNLELDDLVHHGIIGIVHAIDKFNPDLGYRFSTYATYWARKSIIDTVYQQGRGIPITISEYNKLKKYHKAYRELETRLSKEPTDMEICKELNIGPLAARTLRITLKDTCSLDQIIEHQTEDQLGDILSMDTQEPGDELFEQELNGQIAKILDSGVLTKKESEIIRLRFGFNNKEPLNLIATAKLVKLSRQRVSQSEIKALEKLRQLEEVTPLAAYLEDDESALSRLESLREKIREKNMKKKH